MSRATALLIAAALIGGGLFVAALALLAVPLGLGGPGFGYRKLLLLLFGLEAAYCGAWLWRRLGRGHPQRGYPESEVGSRK